MDTNALKKFAQAARNLLIDQVTARLDMVLADGAAARREHPKAIAKLEAAASSNRPQVIEQGAYTWFNRFTALRFMDATGLANPRIVSPADGATRPEILAEALAGNLPDRARLEIAEYLNGTRPAHDGQAEAYRLLLIHACNEWHGSMPYMFERADMVDRAEDYTDLLMPDDLLAPDSILGRLREVMTEEACQDVEIIGWLYQFYISEKKDQVFAGLKKNQKITPENIPAATQLFTPHWIVRYLVENSLGRLWLLNRPESKLADRMDYYIAPEEAETDFLKIGKPEEIKVCDPACGSGHMLTYAFDLLYAIYEEEGYESDKIPALILANNLTGVEIDDRAGALAAFALAMKAAARLGRRRFLRMETKPNICVMQNVRFKDDEIPTYISKIGRDLFTDGLIEAMTQFDQAKNFGSLIVPKLKSVEEVRTRIAGADLQGNLFIRDLHERVQKVLEMSEALSPRYHVVVANPPYMGSGGMNGEMSNFALKNFPDSRSDLYAMFIERCIRLNKSLGLSGLVTIQNWMFISSFEKFRGNLLSNFHIADLIQIGFNSFPELNSKVVQAVAFIVLNGKSNAQGRYCNLNDAPQSANKKLVFQRKLKAGDIILTSDEKFALIPGSPIGYWLTDAVFDIFAKYPSLAQSAPTKQGLATGDNDQFLRLWHEVANTSIGWQCSSSTETLSRSERWYPCNKGGEYRKWYGNNAIVVDWQESGQRIKNFKDEKGKLRSRPQNENYYFRPGLTWSAISSGGLSMRLSPVGAMFETKGAMCFPSEEGMFSALAFANTKIVNRLLLALSPSLDFHEGPIGRLPYKKVDAAEPLGLRCAELGKSDWDAFETSWDFTILPLLSPDHRAGTLEGTYTRLRAHWQSMTTEMHRLEEESNRIFIAAYGLQHELTPEVPINEITLTCNSAFRYGVKSSEEDREARLREDTMAEFLHYAVGCMFGRYSLDAPGMILANQGEGVKDYLARVPEPSFAPDRDNVISVLDADWFADDIIARIRDFLRVTFGEAKFRENLAFIEKALGKDLRRWFTKDFFDYHVRRYKKRPIYWMFSSPKGSFNALIYMHRYRPDTVSVVLNQYVREFIHKLEVERARLEKLAADPTATQGQSTKAQKDIGAVIKQIAELTEWERDVVYPMAQQKIAIDLDDGVKRNYQLFAGAVKPIKGLEATDD